MARSAPGRPPRFSRDQIADVAYAIADREGFEAVSMRRVAQELGAGTMTLYHYVRTKDELVALMDDRLMGLLLVPDHELAQPWREALSAILRRSYRLRLEHPWSLFALQNAAFGPNALRHSEQTLAALEGSPFDADEKVAVMGVTDSFVDGHALRAVERRRRAGADPDSTEVARVQHELQTGPYPRLRRSRVVREGWDPASAAAWMDELFERGLTALLDGLIAGASRGG